MNYRVPSVPLLRSGSGVHHPPDAWLCAGKVGEGHLPTLVEHREDRLLTQVAMLADWLQFWHGRRDDMRDFGRALP
jgi:hypothetical protein